MSDKYINPSGLQTIKTWVESKIPTATSDLVNDSDFISSDDLESASSMTFVSYQTGEVATWENDAAIIPVGGGGGGDIPTRLSQLINDVGYITISSVPTETSQLINDSNFPVDANYVHTDNNFTTALKNKLDGIAAGAEVNVNADWNAVSGDAQILNKPTIPTATSDLTNDSDFQTSTDVATAISGKLDISGGTMTGTLTLSGAPTNDLEASTKKYVDDSISGIGSGLPSQSGNSGKFLTTDGTDASWATVPTPPSAYTSNPEMNGVASAGSSSNYAKGDHVHPTDTSRQANITASGILKGNGSGTITAAVAGTDYQTPLTAGTDYQTPLPSQSGNSGKFLTTDGSALSWGTPSGGGGGDSNIFVATYGTTTTADVEAAYQAGKLIYCIYSSRLYTYGYRSSATAHYFYAWQGNTKYYIYTSSTATWSNSSTSMAPTASPSLTGSPTATTATAGTNSTRIATTAFVTTAISNAITAALAGGY